MAIPDGINADGNDWIGWSFLKFDPIIPPFNPPSGYLLHQEAYRLLPNYALPSDKLAPIYTLAKGGFYPSMVKDNGFNIYLNIIWSADCNGAANC